MLSSFRSHALPRSIWMLGFVSLLMDVSSEMIHSLLPLFMVGTLGASALAVGLIDGLAEATALIVKIFSGVLADWWGKRKPLAVFGYSLGAFTKPLFALATSSSWVLTARLLDRVGKGIRGAPRDALVADLAPPELRGAAFGLRQALDTVGAFLGPILAVVLMFAWENDMRRIFWVAVIPGLGAALLLFLGVNEPETPQTSKRSFPLARNTLRQLPRGYWYVVVIGALFTLARFSEAFLVLLAAELKVPLPLIPLVMVAMNLVYAASAYPFGKLADRMSHRTLLALGIGVLLLADISLARATQGLGLFLGLILWGLHMGLTQGLLATMVADQAPTHLRGTAFGFFNLVSGLSMLVASGTAGWVWDGWGHAATFYVGASFGCMSLLALGLLTPKKV